MEEDVSLIQKWLGNGSINVFGLPFSGKDTHGHKLAKSFGAALISGGQILRESDLHHVKEHISKGHLAPTEEYLATILPYFSQEKFEGNPMILSSIGRWHGEEDAVIDAAAKSGHPIKAVIYLSILESEAERRWHLAERGRDDDSAHHILLNRFNEFRDKTIPVIDYYRKAGLVLEIDAMPKEGIVTQEILRSLAKLSKQ